MRAAPKRPPDPVITIFMSSVAALYERRILNSTDGHRPPPQFNNGRCVRAMVATRRNDQRTTELFRPGLLQNYGAVSISIPAGRKTYRSRNGGRVQVYRSQTK